MKKPISRYAENGAPIPNDLVELMGMMQDLNEEWTGPQREMHEDEFVRNFLPLLTSKEENADLRPWIAVSGGATNRVRIYRIVDGKKVELYVVPPLINVNGITRTLYSHQDSVYERIMTSVRLIQHQPNSGRAIWNKQMEQAAVGDVKLPYDDLVAWNKILIANKLEPIIKGIDESGQPAADKDSIETDGWEDF